jgi:predicted GIY-YIG superfamily endonuclease
MECDMGATAYLIHFDEPYHHARHYLGATYDLASRIEQHRNGIGSPLIRAVNEAGISWGVVRTWRDGFNAEKIAKSIQNNCFLCPICNPQTLNRTAFKRVAREKGKASSR